MRTLGETTGCIDQLNISGLVCMEVLGHRIQSIVDACSGGSSCPNWGLAKYYDNSGPSVDVVSAPLKRHAARKAKEDADLQTAQTKVWNPRSGPEGTDDAGAGSGGKGGGKTDKGGRCGKGAAKGE